LDLRGVALVIAFVFERGCAAADLSSGTFFMLVRMSPAEAWTFVRGIIEYHAVDGRTGHSNQTSTAKEVRLGTRQEHRELAEQIRIDQTYIRAQSGHFKLPYRDAVGSGSTACSAKVAFI
jgi:hypothetical protein